MEYEIPYRVVFDKEEERREGIGCDNGVIVGGR
jgi:hypothetical protein